MRNADEIDWARRYGGRSTLQRFLSKIEHSDNGCWLWTGYTHARNGYGIFRAQAPRQQAHRVMFELYYGRVPEGAELDHLCRVRQCVNPEHLEPVSHKENMARGIRPSLIEYPRDRRTHCKWGHPFDPDSPYKLPNGRVQCAICVRRNKRESYYKKREKMQASPVVGERGT